MKWLRIAKAGGGIACLFAALATAHACGGEIYGDPLGYLDDAGTYHYPDGAVMFGPGTACANYDPADFSKLQPAPACNEIDCTTWLISAVPPGYPMRADCQNSLCRPGLTVSPNVTPEPYPVYCTPGPVGDAYCSAFLTQFVAGEGHAGASCKHQCDEIDLQPGGPPSCKPGGPDFYACVTEKPDNQHCFAQGDPLTQPYDLCVYRGDSGVANTEVPCFVPSTADAGDDQTAASDGGGDQ